VVAFGHSRPGDLTVPNEIDLGDAAVLPGLVNAHTHLELSWMRDRIRDTEDFPEWIRSVVALLRRADRVAAEEARAVGDAIDEARRCGTALIGDISNTLKTSAPLAERGMAAIVFHELVGFSADQAEVTVERALHQLEKAPAGELLRHSLAPHAPYSVSPALFRAIRTALLRDPFARSSVHLGESAAETTFLRDGTGAWRSLLEDLRAWDPSWVAPRCGPVEYLEQMGFLDDRILVVHGVQFDAADLTRLAARGATLVTCPRGNLRTGAGQPPIAAFYEADVRVAVGTDSLASVPDLNLFAELAESRRLAPEVHARALLESATINGARALGFEADFGTIEAGKRDCLIAVDVPRSIVSVEDHLLSGIDPGQVRWLSTIES
jgi:cytosine/adenosine deaminase-related metal-dependent hydrolase